MESEEANKALFRRVVEEVMNKHDVSGFDRFYSPTYEQHNAIVPPGLDGIKRMFTALFTAMPDMQVRIDHLFAEGDYIFAFVTTEGTNTGPFGGAEPSGKPIVMRTAEIFASRTA